MATSKDKEAIRRWEDYRKALITDTALEFNNSKAEIEKHRCELEQDTVAWFKYFFPKYASADFAPFHLRFFKRVLTNLEWYEVLSWSRELSKSTCTMFAVLFLTLTGKKKNVILTSASQTAAEDLLMPYMLNLESNQRIIAYYGEQKNIGSWEIGKFKTKKGVAWRALGAGQSPRGSRNEEIRPDIILVDDFDTDEDCRNKNTLDKKWNWFEQALYPTRSISVPLSVIFCGNIIAKDCCVVRAAARANNHDVVNIRDKHGKSTWPSKNTEEMIDCTLRAISTKSAQQEYFNNPLSEGDVFKEITYGVCPPLQHLKFAVVYADPSTSNKDKPKAGTSFKAVWLIGFKDGKFYVYYGYLDQVSNATFVDWFYQIKNYVAGKTQLYYYIENNTLQDPFYEQVFIPLFSQMAVERGALSISPDVRKKPDKFTRIEGNLEPLNRVGSLVFNIDERHNAHMKRLEEQFLLINPQLKSPADGPDCIEGGVFKLNEKIATTGMEGVMVGFRRKNNKRI